MAAVWRLVIARIFGAEKSKAPPALEAARHALVRGTAEVPSSTRMIASSIQFMIEEFAHP